MPSGKDSEISYRVKCVVVESERVFGDVVLTQQTKDRFNWLNKDWPSIKRKNVCNLKKKTFKPPDFMALNTKNINHGIGNEQTTKLKIPCEENKLNKKKFIENGRIINHTDEQLEKKQKSYPLPMLRESCQEVMVTSLVDQLLLDIYGYPRNEKGRSESDSTVSSHKQPPHHRYLRRERLFRKSTEELAVVLETLIEHVNHSGGLLVRQLRRRDYLTAKRDKQYDVITAHLQAHSAKRSEDTRMRFSLTPQPGESGFTQWLDAMKMVARLQGGIPQEFRKRLWLTLAERHLDQRGVDWKQAEKLCFNEWSNPDDEELGIQIVKDLHRTGCSLFCGAAGRDNQAVLRRVLLGFARWNKSVGYCQGLNVLAALVLQVTDRAESSAVKVMIYLIEGVLPEGYFADNLRGLSIDMAVFRDLLRMRLPKLSRHLEALQSDAKDKATGSSYEPPLTNVFTMQWFLTLFCHCLPQEAVLRVWDLIFLEGDEVLLRTALAIWEGISDRIMTVTSADEFYSIMGVLTREMLEFTDVNNLIKTIVSMGPLYGVTDLREKHRYNITPWARRLSEEEDTDTEEEERLAVAAAMFGVPQRFKKDRSNAPSSALQTIGPSSDRERLALDINTLKHQYAKLRERQRQAHIILSAACARQSMVPSSTSQAMNHLLVGKSALVSAKTRQLGPPPGSLPPKPRTTSTLHPTRVPSGRRDKQGVTLHWKDTKKPKEEQSAVRDEADVSSGMDSTSETMSVTQLTSPIRGSGNDSDSDSTSTELCDEPDRLSDVDSEEPTSTSDCYVMATDDEKSPLPGASPIIGHTSEYQSTDKTSTGKGDSENLFVDDNEVNRNYRDLLSVEGTSSSIAKITDQIRRLSASDDNNLSSISHLESTTESKNVAEDDVSRGYEKLTTQNDDVVEKNVENFYPAPSVIVETDDSTQAHSQVSDKIFEFLDRYDFSSSNDKTVIADKPMDAVSLIDKYRETEMEDSTDNRKINSTSSIKVTSDFETLNSIGSLKTLPRESNPDLNIETFRFGPSSSETYEKSRLESSDLLNADYSKYENSSGKTVTKIVDGTEITSERTFYSPSFVIGHLPISPVTVNEKLSRAAEVSSLTANGRILSKDIGSFDVDVEKNNDLSLSSLKSIRTENKSIDPSTLFTISSFSDPKNSNSQVQKSLESNQASSKITSMDHRVPDTLESIDAIRSSIDKIDDFNYNVERDKIGSLNSELGTRDPVTTDISVGNERHLNTKIEGLDYDSMATIDAFPKTLITSLEEIKINPRDAEKSSVSLSLIVTDTSIQKLSTSYDFKDFSTAKIYDDKKKSPKTPDSGRSFSSGETMGPDSKNSSFTTSPTNRSDSRNFPLDKSERSSQSSESKTLTLRSLDSESGTNGKTRLDAKPDITRPSLDKSSPSTPISTDSLKNKSEISPKFVISSSSESCSPGKTTKSSERSFSSELQSPVSANSIKYRANYAEEQDNLSESSMDICSATSPFYPIANPDQKTPSPYGTTGKLRANGHSEETSPEQKSGISKEEKNTSKYNMDAGKVDATRSIDVSMSSRCKDDYDSGRPFEKELEETLSTLPCDRTKNERMVSLYKDDHVGSSYRTIKTTIEVEENDERNIETDTVSPLPRDKYDGNRSAFVDKSGASKGLGINEREPKYLLGTRETLKPFERSCSSLEKRFGDFKSSSSSSDEFIVNTHKKRSSDILEDLKHLEAKTMKDGNADTSMLTRKTGYVWEDLKNLEARRQDNFSDSASEFSRVHLDPPRISVFSEGRKSYVVEPKINIEEGSDSILKSYSRKKSNGEPDDDRESKLGVWTKVKPRVAGRESGRRSSDRALKIIQENSAILHKILTCQAKKRLPDLEEISQEITISPINEEISKIFSPILEKMGLNEHEINAELARINFKDFDQMTTTSGSEFDAKMNDELSKLSLIDDNEIVDQIDIEEVISRDYLDTREALIDRQINEELSKLLANYEEDSPIRITSNQEEASSCQNPSDVEQIDISSISTNVFSYQSSNESIDMKSELDCIQEQTNISAEKFAPYSNDAIMKYSKSSKYGIRDMSPRSDIDIYRELEKLDKISSGEIMPSSSSSIVAQKIISPIVHSNECTIYTEIRPSSLEYSSKAEKPYERSPMKSPYDTYKPYDFKSRISPRKTPSNPYSARSYEKIGMENSFDFQNDPTTPSRLFDLGTSRPILSKETLEFRVRYDDETSKIMRDDDLNLEPYQTSLVDLDRGASYYSNETSSSSLKRLENEISHDQTLPSPLDCSYNPSTLYTRKYESLSPKNYSYVKSTNEYEKHGTYKYDENIDEAGSYLSVRRKNSHSISPNYQYDEGDYGSSINPYSTELPSSHEDSSKRSVPYNEFSENIGQVTTYGLESETREALNFRKASLSLGPLEPTTGRITTIVDATNSPKSMFSPFPIRNSSRKPKELGLKLGLYSPSNSASNPLKRS